ncbi:MAG: hypothetical protein WD645_03490, partial [Dehalococcoidia bacterium]
VVIMLTRSGWWPGKVIPRLAGPGVAARVLVALGLYALGRFIIGFATAGELHAGLLQSQWIALAVLVGIGASVIRARRRAKATYAVEPTSPARVS